MAPALSIAPREPHTLDPNVLEDSDKPQSHPRRALASVDNLAIHMEEDDMGLQSQPSLAKDSQEMEQILVDLGNTDLVPADLLQAIKTLETGDSLSTGDADAIFPLSGFELPENVDSEGDGVEERIKTVQVRLERRCAFLQRRLRMLQARAIGKRISEEVSQCFEKSTRGARKDTGGRHMGLKTFLKTIETTATLQANAASKTVVGPTYYNPGTSKGDVSRSATIGVPSGTLTGLEDTAGALRSHLSAVKHELDSDATASSSGAESNDEAVTYNNQHQQHMAIEKRALWTWQRARASIASRWCWLQAQVQELEYKIRQHNELHKQVREAKGPVEFEGEPVGYQGSLPGDDIPDDPASETCARVRPLRRETFRKRKLLQMHNLHIATNKAAKPSDISCSCLHPEQSCAVCTGRADCTQPAPPSAAAPPALRIARADPGYHPVLSTIADVSPSLHLSSLAGRGWFRARHAHTHAHTRSTPPARPKRTHPTRLKRGRPPLSRKIAEREKDEDTTRTGHERPRGRSSQESRGWRRASYDIDNIVIPQSIAAANRPQILTYKEIVTPKWRVLEIPETPLNNGVSKNNRVSIESEEEDSSDLAVQRRHERAEVRERTKYMRRAARRRLEQQQLLQQQQQQQQQEPVVPQRVSETLHETVRPYTPRQFPLADFAYQHMLSAMPEGYRPTTPQNDPQEEETDTSSTMSPLSPPDVFADDPDDAEWDPTAEKIDRRKSFR